jgi:hypothetical protein
VTLPDPNVLLADAMPVAGNAPGVFFLFDGVELVYVGQGWNCFLSVAEQTRKDLDRRFTCWTFVEVPDEAERKAMVKALKRLHAPRDNKI